MRVPLLARELHGRLQKSLLVQCISQIIIIAVPKEGVFSCRAVVFTSPSVSVFSLRGHCV